MTERRQHRAAERGWRKVWSERRGHVTRVWSFCSSIIIKKKCTKQQLFVYIFCKIEGQKKAFSTHIYFFSNQVSWIQPAFCSSFSDTLLPFIPQSLPDLDPSTTCTQDQPDCRGRGVFHQNWTLTNKIKTKQKKTKHYSLLFFFPPSPTLVPFPSQALTFN